MKLALFTYEFLFPFSGNGTYSNSLVHSISSSVEEILIICAFPRSSEKDLAAEQRLRAAGGAGNISYLCYPVDGWKRLDKWSKWDQYCSQVDPDDVRKFGPDVIAFIDWHTVQAVEKVVVALPVKCPTYYLNFRVYSANTDNTDAERSFYESMERKCLDLSSGSVVLSSCDLKLICSLFGKDTGSSRVVNPAIRPRISELARTAFDPADGASTSRRQYVICCTRLSPEKNATLFADVLEEMAPTLRQLGYRPYICGVGSNPEYASSIIERIRACCPDAVIEEFVSGERLAEIFSEGVLNFHPSLNEAYGLTVVEAAAFGCPSVVNATNIGCLDLLLDPSDLAGAGVIALEFERLNAIEIGQHLLRMLSGSIEELREIGRRARNLSLGYTTVENAHLLLEVLRGNTETRL